MKRKYELTLVLDPALDDAGVQAEIEKVRATLSGHQGQVVNVDLWGKEQLAYPIKKKDWGHYVLLLLEAEQTVVAEMERLLSINEAVLRFLTVKKDKFAPDLTEEAKQLSQEEPQFGY